MIPKRPLRKLSISKGQPRTESEKQRAAQERYFINAVKNHPKFKMILAHLAQGTSPGEIASHFAQQGWISMNERTFTECLRYFRRTCAKEIQQVERDGLDAIVDPNQPQSDVLIRLHQLLGVQMQRIAIDVKQEQNFTKLFHTTHKEMEVAVKITEQIAKLEGRIGETAPKRKSGEDIPTDVNENLSALKKDQGTRDRLHNLTRQLVGATK